MRGSSLFMLAAGAAAGYAAASRLLAREDVVERVPQAARPAAEQLRAQLLRSRQRVVEALAVAGEARAEAEVELHAQYLQQSGRAAPAPQRYPTPPL